MEQCQRGIAKRRKHSYRPFHSSPWRLHRDGCPGPGTSIPMRRASWDKAPAAIGTLSHDNLRSSHVPLNMIDFYTYPGPTSLWLLVPWPGRLDDRSTPEYPATGRTDRNTNGCRLKVLGSSVALHAKSLARSKNHGNESTHADQLAHHPSSYGVPGVQEWSRNIQTVLYAHLSPRIQ